MSMGEDQRGAGWTPRLSRIDTRTVAPDQRFDLWRSLFQPVHIDLPDPTRANDFQGRCAACIGTDGVLLTELQCDATVSAFPRAQADHVLLSGLVAGDLAARDGGDNRMRAHSGRLHLMDPSGGGELVSGGHWNIYLAMPRAMVADALGRPSIGVSDLPDTPLAGLLWSHMQGIIRHGDAMSGEETTAAMQAASAMALVVLRQMGRGTLQSDTADTEADTLLAAQQFMTAHRHRPRLTVDHVARAVGCSRARLYRVFAARGLSVADQLRDSRLIHGRILLADGQEVGDVALACGYADASSFGKAFRRRFGMPPGEWSAANRGR